MNRIAILLALSLVIGCAKSGDGGVATTAEGKKLRVVYIPKNTGNPYFDEVDKGFQDASTKLGFDYSTTAPATAEATSQIPILKDQIQRGVDVIAISPNSPNALNPVLDQARAKGIAVVTVDADLVGNESHRDAAVLPTDFDKVGESQIELMGKLMGYEGDFAILSATPDAPNQNAWIAKMKEVLKDAKYAKMKLVDTVYGDDEPQKSTTECEALLAKYPNLKGIVSPTSVGLAASAQVLDRAGKKIALTGLSTPNQLKKFVKNGVVPSFQLWSPRDEGFIAAYLGTGIKSGKIKPAAGAEVDVPDLGKRKFSPKLELTGGDIVTFDKDNVEKYDF